MDVKAMESDAGKGLEEGALSGAPDLPKPGNKVSDQIRAAQARKAELDAARAARDNDPDDLIWVEVPRAFKLNVQYVIHDIPAGEQLMIRKWAQMSYSKLNGVTILGEG